MREQRDLNEIQSLRTEIVRRQLDMRREIYDGLLRRYLKRNTKEAKEIVTRVGNFYSFCNYAFQSVGLISFQREIIFLKDYFQLERFWYGNRFAITTDNTAGNFAIPPFTIFPLVREAAINMTECDEDAVINILVKKVGKKIHISICHDIPYILLCRESFRKENTYGFELLKQNVLLSCGGSLVRKATKEGLMENMIIIPELQTIETGPNYLLF